MVTLRHIERGCLLHHIAHITEGLVGGRKSAGSSDTLSKELCTQKDVDSEKVRGGMNGANHYCEAMRIFSGN